MRVSFADTMMIYCYQLTHHDVLVDVMITCSENVFLCDNLFFFFLFFGCRSAQRPGRLSCFFFFFFNSLFLLAYTKCWPGNKKNSTVLFWMNIHRVDNHKHSPPECMTYASPPNKDFMHCNCSGTTGMLDSAWICPTFMASDDLEALLK